MGKRGASGRGPTGETWRRTARGGEGRTFLNTAGIETKVSHSSNRAASKPGELVPSSRIQIIAPERIADAKPDYVVILPWNIGDEIAAQLDEIRAWGGRFRDIRPGLTVWPD